MDDAKMDQLLAAMTSLAAKKPVGRPPKDKWKELERVLNAERVATRYNLFVREVEVRFGDGPWERLDDEHLRRIACELLRTSGTGLTKDHIIDVLETLAHKAEYHPVRDYLDSLEWDRVPRVDNWLKTYGDVRVTEENRELMQKLGAMVLIAAVRRVRFPGCKFDEALVLIGEEGSGKSTLVRTLCPNPEWFTESLKLSSDPKVVIEDTEGIWIAEAPEMIGRKDIEKVKAFLSRRADGPVRLAYAHKSTVRQRQFIVIGTTNEQNPLYNVTGARRFWPVKTGCAYLDDLKRDRDQLWAEAAWREAMGEDIFIDSKLWELVVEQQNKHSQVDPWEETIRQRVAELHTPQQIPTEAVWEWVDVPKRRQTREEGSRIEAIMATLHYRKSKKAVYVASLGRQVYAWELNNNPFDPENFNTSQSANANLGPKLPDGVEEPDLSEEDEFERQEALIEAAEEQMEPAEEGEEDY